MLKQYCLCCNKEYYKPKKTMYCSKQCTKRAWYIRHHATILRLKAVRLKKKKEIKKPVYVLPEGKVRFKDYLISIGKGHLWKSAT